eukprot:48521_1
MMTPRRFIRHVLTLRKSLTVPLASASLSQSGVSMIGSVSLRRMCTSHDDFKPVRTVVEPEAASSDAVETIKKDISSSPVFLYMKGSPDMPQCGFSARVVQVLQSHGASFESRNVLQDPFIREGVKQFSNWPTIPQLYVNGEFIGGCDIIWEMHRNGELVEVLKEAKSSE